MHSAHPYTCLSLTLYAGLCNEIEEIRVLTKSQTQFSTVRLECVVKAWLEQNEYQFSDLIGLKPPVFEEKLACVEEAVAEGLRHTFQIAREYTELGWLLRNANTNVAKQLMSIQRSSLLNQAGMYEFPDL